MTDRKKKCYMDLKTKFRGQNGMTPNGLITFRFGCFVVRMNC